MTAHINIHEAIRLVPTATKHRGFVLCLEDADGGVLNFFFSDLSQAERWARKVLACIAGVEESGIHIGASPPSVAMSLHSDGTEHHVLMLGQPCPACISHADAEPGDYSAPLCAACGRAVKDIGQFNTPDREPDIERERRTR